jgi:catechol 2,3-dioxygenase-like lactoylglutathione lyase family enzyme
MKRTALFLTVFFVCFSAAADDQPKRPRILGIASVRILVTDLSSSREFYSKIFTRDQPCIWCGQLDHNTYSVNGLQYVKLANHPAGLPSNLIDEITFLTDDVPALRRYLTAHNIPVHTPIPEIDDNPLFRKLADQSKLQPDKPAAPDVYLTVIDPEGHRIGFVQLATEVLKAASDDHKTRLIHAGIIVKDRAAEDRFYADLLGFHVYWHGGMKDSDTDWVDMQVPDGAGWLEYMLNVSADADHHTQGIMNHIAIGVPDIEAANFAARKNGISLNEEPKIGRDGKWSFDIYDPDSTRVEFMEYKPAQQPCCNPYTGPQPKP